MRGKSRAFTLVELLLGIAVIGILALVLIQDLRQTRTKAQDANIKSSVNGYRQAMELYNSRYKTFLVYQHGTSAEYCTFTKSTAAGNGFKLSGTSGGASGTKGCKTAVGLNGSGEGQMTRKWGGAKTFSVNGTNITATYPSRSIADILVEEGVLNNVYTFPNVKDFSSNARMSGGAPADFVLTLCDDDGKEASSPETATNFAIYAQVQEATPTDKARSEHLCGASGTPFGWDKRQS